jgi:hypothetical protein
MGLLSTNWLRKHAGNGTVTGQAATLSERDGACA